MSRYRNLLFASLWLSVSVSILLSSSSELSAYLRRPLRTDPDNQTIAQPKEREVSDMYAVVYNTWIRHLNIESKLAKKTLALNVNAWDEVPDSSWFTNRSGMRSLTFEEIVNGLQGQSPDTVPWRVDRRNDSGYTPKVDIDDASHRRYVLKFDPKGARERNSGAERIGTLIAHAAGYNVPHNTIVYFRLEDLKFDDKSYYRDPFDKRRPLTSNDVNSVLQQLDPMPDGRYRGIASLRLPGIAALGPFVFTGRRVDDPNDIIPHEHRREIRGLRVIAAWINHVDIKDHQALDMYQSSPDGRKFVKHYLLDFSATLGAYEWPSAPYRVGNEYMFDASAMGRSLFSLGLWRRPWEVHSTVPYPEIGYFSADLFEPEKWRPSFPNLAFEQMDDGDGYWGAKIVTAFTDETIQKIAEAGEYSRPEATAYVVDVLQKRRDAIGRYWLNRVTPLENFTIHESRIEFRDLAVERRYTGEAKSPRYRFHVEDLRGKKVTEIQNGNSVEISNLAQLPLRVLKTSADIYGRTPVLRVLIQSQGPEGWSLPVEVVLGYQKGNQTLQVLGWTHAPRKS